MKHFVNLFSAVVTLSGYKTIVNGKLPEFEAITHDRSVLDSRRETFDFWKYESIHD